MSEIKEVGGGSTAAVLWLMIALVFLPIIAVHVATVWLADPAQAQAAPDGSPVQLAQPTQAEPPARP